MVRVSFFCSHCDKDFDEFAREAGALDNVKWFTEHRECGRMCFRYRDPKKDPYYKISHKIQQELRRYAKDLVQPNDPEFDTLYPQHKKKREEDLMKKEEEEWKRESKIGSRDKKKLVL